MSITASAAPAVQVCRHQPKGVAASVALLLLAPPFAPPLPQLAAAAGMAGGAVGGPCEVR